MPRRTILTREVGGLEQVLKREARARVRERLVAILWIHSGVDAKRVAQNLGRSRQTVARYVARFNAEGLPGLLTTGRGRGRRCSLARDQLVQLIDWIRVGPHAMGYDFARWNCNRLARLIRHEWGIVLSDERVRQILHAAGVRFLPSAHPVSTPSTPLREGRKLKYIWQWQAPRPSRAK